MENFKFIGLFCLFKQVRQVMGCADDLRLQWVSIILVLQQLSSRSVSKPFCVRERNVGALEVIKKDSFARLQ